MKDFFDIFLEKIGFEYCIEAADKCCVFSVYVILSCVIGWLVGFLVCNPTYLLALAGGLGLFALIYMMARGIDVMIRK